jgi:hypothetical protein
MKRTKNVFLTALMLAAFSVGAWAETPGSLKSGSDKSGSGTSGSGTPADAANDASAAAPAPPTVTAADVQALKDALAAQQMQIDRLTLQLQRQQDWQAHQSAAEAAGKTAQTQATPQQMAALNNSVAIQQSAAQSSGLNLQDTQTDPNAKPNPLESPVISIHFKGITITPGGFAAAEFVRRSRALGADVTTPFNSLTMPGASQSSLSEFFGSARQSRPTIYVDGRMKNVEFSSYVSGDFLSAGVTSSATQTNSYTFRLRQAWGQAKFDNGWSILGGQMWSLLSENKAGIAPSDDLGKTNDARPSTIDPGYNVGFTFARQYGIRVAKDFNHKVALAVSVENAQGTLTTHGNANNFLLGEPGASNTYNTGSNYTFNPSPDIIAKAAFDPGFGHYEVFGLFDRFRDRVFPCGEVTPACAAVSSVGVYNASKNGGGLGANARWNLYNKHIVFGLHGFGGSGVGRYGAAQLSDLAINGNGTLHLIKNVQGLGTLEWHGKKLDVYLYTGAEYASRTASWDQNLNKGAGAQVGYGAPTFANSGCYIELAPAVNTGFTPTSLASCTADTRAVIEGTAGFWYRFYNGPRGRFQFGTQYSYVTRQTWSGTPGTGTSATPEGLDGMVFTSLRYYLP